MADRADGRRRGHPRHRAHRGHRLELGDLPRVPRRARRADVRRSTSARRCRTARCARTRWASAARATSRPPPTTSRRWPPSCRRRSRPARSASRRRARSATARWTASPVPGTFAAEDELFALGRAMAARRARGVRARAARRVGRGPARARARDGVDGAAVRRARPARSRSRCCRSTPRPTLWRGLMDESLRRARRRRAGRAAGRGATVRHAARLPDPPRRSAVGRRTAHWRRACSPDELLAELAKPAVRAQILAETDVAPDPTVLFDGMFQLVQGSLDRLYALGDPPDYEPTPDRTVAAIAEAARRRRRSTMLYDLHARARRPAPADAAVLQLRRAQPRRDPRDAAAPGRRCRDCPTAARTAA